MLVFSNEYKFLRKLLKADKTDRGLFQVPYKQYYYFFLASLGINTVSMI